MSAMQETDAKLQAATGEAGMGAPYALISVPEVSMHHLARRAQLATLPLRPVNTHYLMSYTRLDTCTFQEPSMHWNALHGIKLKRVM